MRQPFDRFISFGILILVTWVLPVSAQEAVQQLSLQGTEAFRVLLHACGGRTLTRLEDLAQGPAKESLLIVFGDLAALDQLPGGWQRFYREGGALLIASNREENRRLRPVGVRLHPLLLPQDPDHAYRQLPDFPLVQPASLVPHPLWRGVERGLATYRPAALSLDSDSPLRPLGYVDHLLGPSAKKPPRFLAPWWTGRQRRLFLAAGTGEGGGPVVVLASASPFQNQLLLQEDNDNWTFARNVLRWLLEKGRRRRVLFLEEGKVQSVLVLPPPRPPRPSAEILDELLCNLEEEDCFNRALLQLADLRSYLQLAAGAATLWLLLAGLRRLWRSSYRSEATAPVLELISNQVWAAPPLLVQRRQAWLRQQNLAEAGRELARLWLASWGLAPSEPPPRVVVRAGWWRRRRWRRLVQHVWELACAPTPPPLRPKHLQNLRRLLAELDAARQAGLLQLQPAL
jgi:hypothetical protein